MLSLVAAKSNTKFCATTVFFEQLLPPKRDAIPSEALLKFCDLTEYARFVENDSN